MNLACTGVRDGKRFTAEGVEDAEDGTGKL
jgi:hypothetical protein